jgi:2-polyprenyl-6-methoxyphenol hydroxylase-like FAD-dependent oxidoreductase
MESWQNITLHHADASVEIDGVGFSAIGRLQLLMLLQARAREVGAELHFETPITSIDQLSSYDLIVAADGVNSIVRRSFEGDFKTALRYIDNKFAWYGTSMRFETLSHTFVRTDKGAFNAHHYRYSPKMSTFLVECDRATWEAYGFPEMTVEESQAAQRRSKVIESFDLRIAEIGAERRCADATGAAQSPAPAPGMRLSGSIWDG